MVWSSAWAQGRLPPSQVRVANWILAHEGSLWSPLHPDLFRHPLHPPVERLGEKLKSGELKDIVAIPTSIRTKEQAESLGIPLVALDSHSGKPGRLSRNHGPHSGCGGWDVGEALNVSSVGLTP